MSPLDTVDAADEGEGKDEGEETDRQPSEAEAESEADFCRFDTHDAAREALCGLGYRPEERCMTACDATRAAILSDANEVLKSRWVQQNGGEEAAKVADEMKGSWPRTVLMDMTDVIPVTSSVAYSALHVAAMYAGCMVKKSPELAVLIARTPLNTPSFLFGHFRELELAEGGDRAASDRAFHSVTEKVRACQQPAAFVVLGGVVETVRLVELPSSAFQAEGKLLARILAAVAADDDSLFSCAVCGRSFLRRDSVRDAVIGVEEVGMLAGSDALYRRACMFEVLKMTGAVEPAAIEPAAVEPVAEALQGLAL